MIPNVNFLKDFEFTNCMDDFIKSPDIDDWRLSKDAGIGYNKLCIELKKHCSLKKHTIILEDKKIDDKSCKTWFGEKKILTVC